jgi:hypothetical protein
VTWCACLIFNELGNGGEEIEGGAHAASESLRSDVDASAREAEAQPLDRLVLEKLVGDGLDDEGVAELSALDDGRGRFCGDDGVVLRAGDGLIESLGDDYAGGDDVDDFAFRMSDRGHLGAAERADALLRRHRIDHGHALEVRGRRVASGVGPLFLRLGGHVRSAAWFGRREAREGQDELMLEARERLRARTLSLQVSEALHELGIEITHPADECEDRDDDLHELHGRDHLFEPSAHLPEVRRVGGGDRLLHRPPGKTERAITNSSARTFSLVRGSRAAIGAACVRRRDRSPR